MRKIIHGGAGQRTFSAMMIGMATPAVARIGKAKMKGGLYVQLCTGAYMTFQAAVAHVFPRPERCMTGGTIPPQVGMSVDPMDRRGSPFSIELARAEDRLPRCKRGNRNQRGGQDRSDDTCGCQAA